MRIAYCEDEPAQRSRMELLLRTFAERKRLPLTVEAFSDSAAFLFQYPGSYPFDLIFLDIDLGGMDGMALARKIRETDSEVPILFLTNHKEYVFEGYEKYVQNLPVYHQQSVYRVTHQASPDLHL